MIQQHLQTRINLLIADAASAERVINTVFDEAAAAGEIAFAEIVGLGQDMPGSFNAEVVVQLAGETEIYARKALDFVCARAVEVDRFAGYQVVKALIAPAVMFEESADAPAM